MSALGTEGSSIACAGVNRHAVNHQPIANTCHNASNQPSSNRQSAISHQPLDDARG